MRHAKRSTTLALLALLCISTQAQLCSQSARRKLLEAEDNAAVIIQKAEAARSIALKDHRIDQETATNIDRALLRINTAVKRVSKAGDALATDPSNGTGGFRDAMRGLRTVLDEVETSINDETLGVKNPDSKRLFAGFVSSLRSIAATIEGIIGRGK